MSLWGFFFLFNLFFTPRIGITQDRPKASILVNMGTIPHFDELNKMGHYLNTHIDKDPDKKRFLWALQRSDILYINTHLSLEKGSILAGETALMQKVNQEAITQDDVRDSLREHSPKLIVLVSGAGSKYNWSRAFSPATVIDFPEPIIGMAGDVYFTLFFEAWTGRNLTIQEALAYADQKVLEQRGQSATEKLLMDSIKAVINSRIVNGNDQMRYLEKIWQPGNWEEINVDSGGKRTIQIKREGPKITAQIGRCTFSGYEKDNVLTLTFKLETHEDISVLEGPIPLKVKNRILEKKLENHCTMEISSATEMKGTCMDSWRVEWDKDEELVFYTPEPPHPVIWKKLP